jgi:hypothetical protein
MPHHPAPLKRLPTTRRHSCEARICSCYAIHVNDVAPSMAGREWKWRLPWRRRRRIRRLRTRSKYPPLVRPAAQPPARRQRKALSVALGVALAVALGTTLYLAWKTERIVRPQVKTIAPEELIPGRPL